MQKTYRFSKIDLKNDIMKESRALKIQSGSAEVVANKVVEAVSKRFSGRTTITKSDLERVVAEEIEKYNADLAYVYRNRGKII